jgi:hypothetical protein
VAALFTRRDRRVVTLAVVHATLAFGLSVFAPMLLFVLGPVLLGVVHVAADVRYLVLRQELAKYWRSLVWMFCAALVLVRVLWEAGVPGDVARVETLLVMSFVLFAIVVAARQSRNHARTLVASSSLCVIAGLTLQYPLEARLVAAQLHNLVALALWAILLRERVRLLLVPLLVVLTFAGVLLSGAFHQVSLAAGSTAFGLHVLEAAAWLCPGLREDYAIGLVSCYVFLQSIHYAVWLMLIPQQQTPAQGTLTFRMSARSLLKDFGALSLAAVGLTALFVLVSACFDVHRTRTLYLSLAMFHTYLELAFLAYFWVNSRPKTLAQAVA